MALPIDLPAIDALLTRAKKAETGLLQARFTSIKILAEPLAATKNICFGGVLDPFAF